MEISVIIPTYEFNNYVLECLESLKKQTLDKEKYEILMIVNGENQEYYQNLKVLLKKLEINNIKVFYTEEKGVAKARNIGIFNSKGKYIFFLDDDDYIDTELLEKALESLKQENEGYIGVSRYINFFNTKERKWETRFVKNFRTNNLLFARKTFSTIGGKLIPKSIIANEIFDEALENGEDSYFMFKISKNIKGIVEIKNVYYYRRIRENSLNFKIKSKKEILKIVIKLEKKYINLFFYKKYNKRLLIARVLAVLKWGGLQILMNLKNNKKRRGL